MDATKRTAKFHKIVRFAVISAYDLLAPGIVDKTQRISTNFYRTFLIADDEEKQELEEAAGNLSEEERSQLVQAVLEELKSQGAFAATEQEVSEFAGLLLPLVDSLQDVKAAEAKTEEQASEALRNSLNQKLPGSPIPKIQLSAAEKTIGGALLNAPRRSPQATSPQNKEPEIPGYAIIRLLGSGAFADVYLAQQEDSKELRALKVGILDEPERFEREIRLVSELEHPHLVKYREWGTQDGQFWIAMDYLGGWTLADLIRQESFRSDPLQILPLAEQILLGLEALHDRGIIHRDLKPENVIIDEEFRLRLIDFGLVKFAGQSTTSLTMSITQGEGLLGTPLYMSPEQFRETKNLDTPSDIYSFGAMFYEMLTGKPPHEAPSYAELSVAVLTQSIDFDCEKIPEELEEFLRGCLALESSDRYQTASKAHGIFQPLQQKTCNRITAERDRETWRKIVDDTLLEQFAADHQGELPENAEFSFLQYLSLHDVEAVDQERLESILPPIFKKQRKVVQAQLELQQAKTDLSQKSDSLSSSEIAEHAEAIAFLENKESRAISKVTKKVRELLKDVLPLDPPPPPPPTPQDPESQETLHICGAIAVALCVWFFARITMQPELSFGQVFLERTVSRQSGDQTTVALKGTAFYGASLAADSVAQGPPKQSVIARWFYFHSYRARIFTFLGLLLGAVAGTFLILGTASEHSGPFGIVVSAAFGGAMIGVLSKGPGDNPPLWAPPLMFGIFAIFVISIKLLAVGAVAGTFCGYLFSVLFTKSEFNFMRWARDPVGIIPSSWLPGIIIGILLLFYLHQFTQTKRDNFYAAITAGFFVGLMGLVAALFSRWLHPLIGLPVCIGLGILFQSRAVSLFNWFGRNKGHEWLLGANYRW